MGFSLLGFLAVQIVITLQCFKQMMVTEFNLPPRYQQEDCVERLHVIAKSGTTHFFIHH